MSLGIWKIICKGFVCKKVARWKTGFFTQKKKKNLCSAYAVRGKLYFAQVHNALQSNRLTWRNPRMSSTLSRRRRVVRQRSAPGLWLPWGRRKGMQGVARRRNHRVRHLAICGYMFVDSCDRMEGEKKQQMLWRRSYTLFYFIFFRSYKF